MIKNCPKCLGHLEDLEIEEVEIRVCNLCHGMWLTLEQLQEILKIDMICCNISDLNKDEFASDALDHDHPTKDKEGHCPQCPSQTTLISRKSEQSAHVTLWACPHNHGLWIDGGDIHRLRSALLKKILIGSALIITTIFLLWGFFSFIDNADALKKEVAKAEKHAELAKNNPSSMALYSTHKFIISPDEADR
jgi:Zn-finger nucleic acid-binding protein